MDEMTDHGPETGPLQVWIDQYTAWADEYLAYAARRGLDSATQLDALDKADQLAAVEVKRVLSAWHKTTKHLRHHIQRRKRRNAALPLAREEFSVQWRALLDKDEQPPI